MPDERVIKPMTSSEHIKRYEMYIKLVAVNSTLSVYASDILDGEVHPWEGAMLEDARKHGVPIPVCAWEFGYEGV